MKNQNSSVALVSLINAVIAKVVYLPGNVKGQHMAGVLEDNEGCRIGFDFDTSRGCIVNVDEVILGDGRTTFTKIGDHVMVLTDRGEKGRPVVVAWTNVQDHDNAAAQLIESRKAKLAPAIVLDPVVSDPVIASDAPKNQRRDRRQFVPRKLVRGQLEPVVPFENTLQAAAAQVEALKAS